MATLTQQNIASKSVEEARDKWRHMTPKQRASSKPEGQYRAKPGTKSTGEYYRIEVRPKEKFTTFRYQDVGIPGRLQRLAGKRPSGSWATQAWLVNKKDAHIEGEKLIPDSFAAKELFSNLGSQPIHVEGDIFKAKDRGRGTTKKPTDRKKKS